MMLPKDPVILLSYINMKLRNEGKTLQQFCEDEEIDVVELCHSLDQIDYQYSAERNQFI